MSQDPQSQDQPRSSDELRVAFIGAGGISHAYGESLREVGRCRLVAVADLDEAKARALQQQYGFESVYVDYDRMLDEVRPEAVVVATPNSVHAPASIAALQAGAHVIVEKPMAMNVEEAQAMVDAAAAAGRKLVVGFQWRFRHDAQYLKRVIDAGELGGLMFARCHAMRRRGVPSWGAFTQKKLSGGGPMIDVGVHIMEAAHFLMGRPTVASVSGQTFTYMGDKQATVPGIWGLWDHTKYDVEDLAIGQVRFTNGAMLTIEASFIAHIQPWTHENIVLMGERGGAQLQPPEIYRDHHGVLANLSVANPADSGHPSMFTAKVRNFVEHVLDDTPSMAPGEDGVAVQRMIDGVYRSAETGSEIHFA